MLRVLNLSGNAHAIGQQHGVQVGDLRLQIVAAMKVRLAALRQKNISLEPYLEEIAQIWEVHAPGTLAILHGMSASLELPWEQYFIYTIASYLTDRLKALEHPDGCTSWAAAGVATRDGAPIMAKNRDYRPDHQPLQCLARIKPAHGHTYLCLTSAGSPGVFSSGINEAGLAVADTHVVSNNIGPGIARYSLMMQILERLSTTAEAISYIKTVPHFGDGTIVLADAQGNLAAIELAHSAQAVRTPVKDYIVSTNHFSAPETSRYWVENNPPRLAGNSLVRRRVVEVSIEADFGKVDTAWAQALMARHGDDLGAICRHPEMDAHSVSISAVIFLPRQASLYVTNGLPCQTPFELHRVME
jgi:isopenicillin-N N-acyltransferase-like protein